MLTALKRAFNSGFSLSLFTSSWQIHSMLAQYATGYFQNNGQLRNAIIHNVNTLHVSNDPFKNLWGVFLPICSKGFPCVCSNGYKKHVHVVLFIRTDTKCKIQFWLYSSDPALGLSDSSYLWATLDATLTTSFRP